MGWQVQNVSTKVSCINSKKNNYIIMCKKTQESHDHESLVETYMITIYKHANGYRLISS